MVKRDAEARMRFTITLANRCKIAEPKCGWNRRAAAFVPGIHSNLRRRDDGPITLHMLKKLLTVVGLGIAGIFMLVYGVIEFRETQNLTANGKKTSGEVVGFEEKSGRRGRTKYYLTVSFKTDSGTNVTATSRVSSAIYSDAVQTKRAPVVYVPSAPDTCRFGSEVKKDFAGIGVGVFLLCCSAVTGLRRRSAG
jgi:hypothetical protein